MAELDINYLAGKLQLILDKTHSHSQKRVLKVKHDRISMACPICGDSGRDSSQKRGHLFLNNLYYKCYNEDCKSTFTRLCKDYDIQIDPGKKLELVNYIDTHFHMFKQNEDEYIVDRLSKMIELQDLQRWFDSGKGPLRAFKPVQFGSQVHVYLKNRGIPEQLITTLFYEGIKQIGRYAEPTVVFLNRMGDKVIGMQERNLLSGDRRRFKIWTFTDIYNSVYDTELDPIESISYNKISYLFNILNIDFERKITLFEGYLDSVFMPNSIGAVGANTDFNYLLYHELDIQFFFDNDKVGKKKAKEWLNKGYPVFLWDKLLHDLAAKSKDPHAYRMWFKTQVKDLNQLMNKVRIHYKELYKYFSTSVFDKMWIQEEPYVPKIKREAKPPKIHNIDWTKKIKELKGFRR
jgi:hypothetical protein